MRKLLWMGALAGLLTYAYSCSPSAPPENTIVKDTISYQLFVNGFDSLYLPYTLPAYRTEAGSRNINKKYIEAFFTGRDILPVYDEERDVPAIEENIDVAEYYYDRIFTTNHIQGFIIEKKEAASIYFYLFTFTPQGQYISGLCLAFAEGTLEEKTERHADIKEDLSIQIRQSEYINGRQLPGSITEFFEINADGELVKLNKTQANS